MQKLPPTLNLRSCIFLVVGLIIGSGVFKKIVPMSVALQSPTLVLGCWVLAGLVSLAGALCTAEMASLFPNSGGEYFYFQKVYNRFFAFLYGWANFAVMKTASIAALAYIFSQSVNNIIPLPQWTSAPGTVSHFFIDNFSIKVLASGLIAALSYLNYRGIRKAEKLSRVMTILLLVASVLIIGAGLMSGKGSFSHLTTPSAYAIQNPLTGWHLFSAVIIASLGAFWGYEGWNSIGHIGEEIKNPKKNLPLALGIGTLIVMTVYVLLNLVYFYILPVDSFIALKNTPNKIAAVEVLRTIGGSAGALFISVLILVTTFNACNTTILASARVFYAMARDGIFFSKASTVHPQYETPSVSLGLQCLWSTFMIWSGSFDQLTDMLIFASFIFYGSTAFGLIRMRVKAPELERVYKVPGYPFVPALFCLFCLMLLVFTLYNQPREALAGLGLIALGIPFYMYWTRGKKQENI